MGGKHSIDSDSGILQWMFPLLVEIRKFVEKVFFVQT